MAVGRRPSGKAVSRFPFGLILPSTGTLSFQLNFDHYLTNITADVKDGELDGQLIVTHRSPINITPGANSDEAHDYTSPFHAKRYVATATAASMNAPSIDGVRELPHRGDQRRCHPMLIGPFCRAMCSSLQSIVNLISRAVVRSTVQPLSSVCRVYTGRAVRRAGITSEAWTCGIQIS